MDELKKIIGSIEKIDYSNFFPSLFTVSGIVVPGGLYLFFTHRNIFDNYDIWKLLFISSIVSIPFYILLYLFAVNIFFKKYDESVNRLEGILNKLYEQRDADKIKSINKTLTDSKKRNSNSKFFITSCAINFVFFYSLLDIKFFHILWYRFTGIDDLLSEIILNTLFVILFLQISYQFIGEGIIKKIFRKLRKSVPLLWQKMSLYIAKVNEK